MALFRSRNRKPLGPGGRMITGLAGLALVVYAAAGTVGDYLRIRDLAAVGQQTPAQITDTRADRSGRRSSSNKYFVTARFAHASGGSATAECQVTETCFLRFKQASTESPMPAAVVVHPSDAGNWHPADDLAEHQDSLGWMLLLYSALSVGLLGTAVWGAVGLARSRQR